MYSIRSLSADQLINLLLRSQNALGVRTICGERRREMGSRPLVVTVSVLRLRGNNPSRVHPIRLPKRHHQLPLRVWSVFIAPRIFARPPSPLDPFRTPKVDLSVSTRGPNLVSFSPIPCGRRSTRPEGCLPDTFDFFGFVDLGYVVLRY